MNTSLAGELVAGLGQTGMRSNILKASTAASIPFITGDPSGRATRTDFTGNLGCWFSVDVASIVVTDLGAWVMAGNTQTHTIILLDDTGNPISNADVNFAGKPDGDSFVSIVPVTLLTGSYRLGMSVFAGGDPWFQEQVLTTTTDGTLITSAYGPILENETVLGQCYSAPNFKYHL